MTRCISLLGALAICCPMSSAARPFTVQAAADYHFARLGGSNLHGAGAGVASFASISDSWMVGGRVGYSALGGNGVHHVARFAASLLWKLDFVQWVPIATLDVGLGLTWLGEGVGIQKNLDLRFAIGLDYLISRRYSVGFRIAYHLVATDLSRFGPQLTAGPVLAWRWD